MKLHFIAIGGSAMHNLAIAMHRKGAEVTGSDDEIFEPSRGRLDREGLLPDTIGWEASRIDESIDAVILGMHAREDNPELLRAKELGIPIYSYPEYLYEETKGKKRVVIGGSHGKTSITAMILHVLNELKIDCDYMVGAQLEGFDCMVKLSDAPIVILEGDEYLSSPIDRRPKFHLYKPHLALISGIAWDHINVFPTYENYVSQFKVFIDTIEPEGTLVYCSADPEVNGICKDAEHLALRPYDIAPHEIRDGITYLQDGAKEYELAIFGKHNLQNLAGARLICKELGVTEEDFNGAIGSFTGASKRLELVKRAPATAIYKDFAHSPSKLKATTAALKEQFENRTLVACMELHTFSSLNATFLEEYVGSMELADKAFVYFNPHTLEHKKLPPVNKEQVKHAFASDNISVFTDSAALRQELLALDWDQANLLMMSSGNFDGIDYTELAAELLATV